MTAQILPEFSRLIYTFDIGLGETNINISANTTECEALADRFSIKKLQYLSASLNFAKSNRREKLQLNAYYVAKIIQICVVTLEPLTNIIHGEFSSRLVQKDQYDSKKSFIFDFNDLDQTEIMDDGYFDAGELVSEFLSLEINPFPRSNNAEFEKETVLLYFNGVFL